jgi:hypothetical protein
LRRLSESVAGVSYEEEVQVRHGGSKKYRNQRCGEANAGHCEGKEESDCGQTNEKTAEKVSDDEGRNLGCRAGFLRRR